MALVRSSWSGVGQVGVRTTVGVLGVVQDSPAGKGNGKGGSYANVLTILTFAPMNGHSLNPLE